MKISFPVIVIAVILIAILLNNTRTPGNFSQDNFAALGSNYYDTSNNQIQYNNNNLVGDIKNAIITAAFSVAGQNYSVSKPKPAYVSFEIVDNNNGDIRYTGVHISSVKPLELTQYFPIVSYDLDPNASATWKSGLIPVNQLGSSSTVFEICISGTNVNTNQVETKCVQKSGVI